MKPSKELKELIAAYKEDKSVHVRKLITHAAEDEGITNKEIEKMLKESKTNLSFLNFLIEAGQAAGGLEVAKTDIKTARAFAEKEFEKKGQTLDSELPDFDKNYKYAKSKANLGKTQRKDMPVIDEKDVRAFQRRLKDGYIDIRKPFAPDHKGSNPFPKGLTGETAKLWLEDGLEKHDGHATDDKIKVTMTSKPVGALKPIQKQIYFSISMAATASSGITATKKFLQGAGSTFIISSDDYILDGHHRFLSGVLTDPKQKVKCLEIDLPVKTLLPMSLSYSSAVGNRRNE